MGVTIRMKVHVTWFQRGEFKIPILLLSRSLTLNKLFTFPSLVFFKKVILRLKRSNDKEQIHSNSSYYWHIVHTNGKARGKGEGFAFSQQPIKLNQHIRTAKENRNAGNFWVDPLALSYPLHLIFLCSTQYLLTYVYIAYTYYANDLLNEWKIGGI